MPKSPSRPQGSIALCSSPVQVCLLVLVMVPPGQVELHPENPDHRDQVPGMPHGLVAISTGLQEWLLWRVWVPPGHDVLHAVHGDQSPKFPGPILNSNCYCCRQRRRTMFPLKPIDTFLANKFRNVSSYQGCKFLFPLHQGYHHRCLSVFGCVFPKTSNTKVY